MSFGFSLGDFITVGRLIKDIVESLQDTEKDYQELVRELEGLQKALGRIDRLRGHGDRAVAIDQIKCAALTCHHPLEAFLSKIRKHEKSLGVRRSGDSVEFAGAKVHWAFSQKAEAKKLRDYLNIHVGTINMLLAQHGLAMLDIAAQQSESNHQCLKNRIEDSSSELRETRGDLQTQALSIRENRSMIQQLLWMVGSDVVTRLKALMDMVTNICVSTQQIYTVILELKANMTGVDTRFTFFQTPVKVEDVLGRVFPFPSECSIVALDAEIKARFETGPGSKKVKTGRYEMFNARDSEQRLTTTVDSKLLPGMSLLMAVILKDPRRSDYECPTPRCPSRRFVEALGGGSNCTLCNVWFDGYKKNCERKAISQYFDLLLTSDEHIAKYFRTILDYPDDDDRETTNFKRIRFDRRFPDQVINRRLLYYLRKREFELQEKRLEYLRDFIFMGVLRH